MQGGEVKQLFKCKAPLHSPALHLKFLVLTNTQGRTETINNIYTRMVRRNKILAPKNAPKCSPKKQGEKDTGNDIFSHHHSPW